MYELVIIGIGLTLGITRCIMLKKKGKSKKIKYYNYSKYAIRYKKYNDAINEQSKAFK